MSQARLIPVEELFANPLFSGASISSDGERIAYLAPVDERTQVWVRGVDEGHDDAVCVTHDTRRGIKTFYWTDDPRWLLYLQDTDGDELWHLYRVDLSAPDRPAVDLTPLEPGRRVTGVEMPKTLPGTALVTMNPRGDFVDVYRVDIATGETTLHLESPDATGNYFVGASGAVYYRLLSPVDDAWEFYAVDGDESRLICRLDGPTYPLGPYPCQVTPDGAGLLLGMYPDGSDELALIRVDGRTGGQTVVAAREGRQLCALAGLAPAMPPAALFSRGTGEVIAARFVGDRPSVEVVDPAYTEILAQLASLSDGVIATASSDAAGRRWLVTFTHDVEPGRTYLYDAETGEGRLLFEAFPQLAREDLAPVTAVHLTARDGRPLHAFLTLPTGVDPTGLPLVLHVHGGPWIHDFWSFHATTQFLANRGYAVLQVNFRGSGGYGRAHTLAAVREFAGAMHDDLIDACDWAVKEGYADPTRLGIYGGSYGGYSALVGVTVTPDRFAAAVDYCGISDLPNFIRTWSVHHGRMRANTWDAYCGNVDDPADLKELLARSPITMVDRITTPLLVAQGAQDIRVVQAEADNIVEALRARGVPVEYLLAEDEGHGFANPENNVRSSPPWSATSPRTSAAGAPTDRPRQTASSRRKPPDWRPQSSA